MLATRFVVDKITKAKSLSFISNITNTPAKDLTVRLETNTKLSARNDEN